MTLVLHDYASPAGLEIKTYDAGFVLIGPSVISMADFCDAVRYVLTNTDAGISDPRVALVCDMRRLSPVPGFNDGCTRLAAGA